MLSDFLKKPVLRLDFPGTLGKMRERKFKLSLLKFSAKRTFHPPERRKQIYLFDLDIIPCIGFAQTEREKYRRGIWSRAHNDSFSDDLARRVIPFILCRHASESIHSGPGIHVKSEPFCLISVFMLGARIAEDSEIVAHPYTLSTA